MSDPVESEGWSDDMTGSGNKNPSDQKRTVPGYGLTMRLEIKNFPGELSRVTQVIAEAGGNLGSIEIIELHPDYIVREISINTGDAEQANKIVETISSLENIKVIQRWESTYKTHRGGIIQIENKLNIKTLEEMSQAYTSTVANISQTITEDPANVWPLTIKQNTVAVVSDGSAVLGMGNLGSKAAIPVMEGKAMLFKRFGGVDAFPICIETQDPEEIINIVENISPVFGGINLEDISSPRCFHIEEELQARLDIPVFHSDQHATAVVVLAAIINTLKIIKKEPRYLKVMVCGVGAAGIACTRLMMTFGIENIVGCDREGIVFQGRKKNMNPAKEWFAANTNRERLKGDIRTAMEGADLFLGLSGPGVIDAHDIMVMAEDPVVFALANPDPEVNPREAKKHCRVLATGRSDHPNQINNVLCFPGLFRGALDCYASCINDEMKLAAASAIADSIQKEALREDNIIPNVFDKHVFLNVAKAVIETAHKTGVSRRKGAGMSGAGQEDPTST
jgi:malate dehydrogenase (oxaloacetate-decarboxylating)